MIYLRNNKVNTCYLGDKKLNKIYLGDKLVWPQKKSFDANGHDFVEIAGIKWATMNVGANKVTDYGLYFQWGDTQGYTADQVGTGEGKKKFKGDWSDYKSELRTRYNTKGMTLALEDDAAHVYMKGSWRMPTSEEFGQLHDEVTTDWTDSYNESGVAGLVCTAKDGKQLFFPACGYANDGSMYYVGSLGRYWSSSLFSSSVDYAYDLRFRNGLVGWSDYYNRCSGFAVRGVLAEN